jgi:hypothetical protein
MIEIGIIIDFCVVLLLVDVVVVLVDVLVILTSVVFEVISVVKSVVSLWYPIPLAKLNNIQTMKTATILK